MLKTSNADVNLVVVFGAHRSAEGPLTVFLDEGWQTPLGPLQNARTLAARLAAELRAVEEPVQPRRPDNAAELLMPFVRFFFPSAKILMLGVPASAEAIEVGALTARVIRAHGRHAVFVGSTDLTHYGPDYGFSPRGHGEAAVEWVRDCNNKGFLDLIVKRDASGALRHAQKNQSACCPGAVAACMSAVASEENVEPMITDHYLSWDIEPAPNYVGYAGVVL